MKKLRLNSQARKAFQGNSRGFTMIEVLIAIAILGIISIGFLSALATSSLSVALGDERTVAESLARRQIEYVKNQGYIAASVLNNYTPTYQKISGIPEGYSIWSVASTSSTVVISENITGIPWDSADNRPVNMPTDKDVGLQKISLVIKHEDKEIYTFVNTNLNWATGANITLEGYKVDR
jgi:prepilin-type N-terminal cleavage/methylation domain-containing protein